MRTARQRHLGSIGTIYARHGPKLERVTVIDASNAGAAIWRIKLAPWQRAVGIYYGHCRASIEGSQVGEFGAVGGSRISDGGVVNRLAIAHADRVARVALARLTPLTRKQRPSRPIPVSAIVDAVCWQSESITDVSRRYRWPDSANTRHRIREALLTGLEAVDDAWQRAGVRFPSGLGQIEVG